MVKTFMEVDHNNSEPVGDASDISDPESSMKIPKENPPSNEENEFAKESDSFVVLDIALGKTEVDGPIKSPRFGGLANIVDSSIRSIQSASSAILHHMIFAKASEPGAPFVVTPKDLGDLSTERTHQALARVLSKAASNLPAASPGEEESLKNNRIQIEALVKRIGTVDDDEGHRKFLAGDSHDAVQRKHDMEMAANALATVVLRSKPDEGIRNEESDIEFRRTTFGTNAIAEKKLDSFLKLCWNAVQDFVLIMLIALGIIGILVETTIGLEPGEQCGHCWLEGAAILTSVVIVVLVTASIDYAKQFAFIRLTHSLNETNTKMVIRDGQQVSVTDDEIVVGDILSVNSHNLASIPADCVVLGPPLSGGLKMDESTLTGESVLISKNPGDVVLSGTTAIQGSAKMVVIAVGTNSVAGKIKARVYESSDHEGEGLDGDEDSPLFVKLEKIAKKIGVAGTCAATLSLVVNCIKGFAFGDEDPKEALIEYIVTAITVLAVSVPEGLPLAVTLALAYSSNKMMKEQNLVKHLDACETMGCATTICTDKVRTLTANKMTARAIYTTKTDFSCNDPATTLGDFVRNDPHSPKESTLSMISTLIAVDTMDETTLQFEGSKVVGSTGNPTEVALLVLAKDLGYNYQEIRDSTRGRSDKGELAEFLVEGKQIGFSSARKMMSWVVPIQSGGYRIYCKGATEVLVARCTHEVVNSESEDSAIEMGHDSRKDILSVAEAYARRGMRTLGLAYKDIAVGVDFDAKSETLLNSDGSEALCIETELVFLALVGIEDPLRPEVPGAIKTCYEAGIDVRLVTGDSPNTAVSIAYQAGILQDFHFTDAREKVASNLKPNVLMEGKTFRRKVYKIDEDGNKEFDQPAFDVIWPHLRVLARSSPDDKLTLAHGLNQSMLFMDKKTCEQLKKTDNIVIFPDRQVVAMTGDGTNDAPALKRADIGFAMGVSGTQIAKDAADIILLDDNFASIVTAAKWGRNVYASIQKFLQFQLTVNIAAVVTALVGSFAYAKSPLAAIQLLWVNLIMDSLASLALASEPPTDELLKRPPTNRSKSIIASRMWANMFGQALYQICVIMFLLFFGPEVFGFEDGHLVESDDGLYPGWKKEKSVHYTLIFNTFVWMQLFNEVNSRCLEGEVNVFRGIEKNYLFCGILTLTVALQIIMVEFAGLAMSVVEGGLDAKYWGVSMAFGSGSLVVQQVINIFYKYVHFNYGIWRERRRLNTDRYIATRHIDQ